MREQVLGYWLVSSLSVELRDLHLPVMGTWLFVHNFRNPKSRARGGKGCSASQF